MAGRSSKRGGASNSAKKSSNSASANSTAAPTKRKRFIDYPRANYRGIRRWIPSWKLILGSFVTFILLLVGSFAAAVAFTTVPEANEVSRSEKTIVYWNDGKAELGRLGESNRISIPLEKMPENLRNAALAAEDREFYSHGGFDPTALARAAWNDLSGGDTQGGSTITQQYAKNAFLTHEQTVVRKAKELLLSVKLETEASKDQILEDYLNTIYFGRG
ncbi:MAG: transglycosylase domain-containing protein, partial [Actinobacteria bacterium]|nr:transglycosylase domain-containing protein [Actinomycetota bacterium]